jgi:hypothetical protein
MNVTENETLVKGTNNLVCKRIAGPGLDGRTDFLLCWRLGGSQSHSGRRGEEKNLPLRELNSVIQPLGILLTGNAVFVPIRDVLYPPRVARYVRMAVLARTGLMSSPLIKKTDNLSIDKCQGVECSLAVEQMHLKWKVTDHKTPSYHSRDDVLIQSDANEQATKQDIPHLPLNLW